MSPLEQRIVAVIDSTANLIALLRELDELREQVRKALAVSQESATTTRLNHSRGSNNNERRVARRDKRVRLSPRCINED